MKASRHSRSFVGWLASLRCAMEPLINRRGFRLHVKPESLALVQSWERIASRAGGHVAGVSYVGHGQEATVLLPGRFRLDRFATAGSGPPA